MEYILTTDNLTKIYGEKRAANAISLHIKKGEVYGLIGRNGSYYSIDTGIEPDLILTKIESFYDREALTEYINNAK